MKILVVGGGGREHTILWKLAQSPRKPKLYCAPGNGGISKIAQCVDIGATEIEKMVEFAKKEAMDLVVVAPDDPLALGMVDALEEAGYIVSRIDVLSTRRADMGAEGYFAAQMENAQAVAEAFAQAEGRN